MNDFQMPRYRQYTPSTVKRARKDANFGSQLDIYANQSPNLTNSTPRQQCRRSSIAYFADGSPSKFDMSFDSDEIFRPENVLNLRRADDVQQQQIVQSNANATLSAFTFPFSNYRSKTNTLPTVVSEAEDESRSKSVAKTISLPPFCSNVVTPPHVSSSTKQEQYNQYSMMMESNEKKRKEMRPSPPPQPSQVRFRSHQAESWMEKYEELLDFRLSSGHCLVPNQYPANPSLAEWVKRQRYQYKLKGMGKHSSMSNDRVVALEKLGFVWNSHDAVWEERLKELKQYKNLFGNTNVPSKYEPNPQLAIWIKRQRRQYKFLTENKPSTMTPYRVGKLTEIYFSWSGRKPKVPT
jgi:hypothetical protein